MASRNTKATTTPATRASARAKAPTPRPQIARTTRAASKTKDITQATDPVTTSFVTPARKPLWNRDNALPTTTGTVRKPMVTKTKLKVSKVKDDTEGAEREPIKVL